VETPTVTRPQYGEHRPQAKQATTDVDTYRLKVILCSELRPSSWKWSVGYGIHVNWGSAFRPVPLSVNRT
jgi:hypothetical protein